jgi:hypothetical protein
MPDESGTEWNRSSLTKELGITAASTLRHVKVVIPPGYYILFMGHLLHAGAECTLSHGGWRLHM